MPINKPTFGKAVRVLRSARGFSQQGLALRANLNGSTLSLIETGRRVPSQRTRASIASALSVPLALVEFLATDPKELNAFSPDQAEEFSRLLVRLVLEADLGES